MKFRKGPSPIKLSEIRIVDVDPSHLHSILDSRPVDPDAHRPVDHRR